MSGEGERSRGLEMISGALLRARIFILAGAFAATIAALYVVQDRLLPAIHAAWLPMVVWAAGLYLLLQSARVALIAMAAPLIAMSWWEAILSLLSPEVTWSDSANFSLVGAGGVLAAILSLRVLLGIARGVAPVDSARQWLVGSVRFAALVVLVVVIISIMLTFPNSALVPSLVIGGALVFLACVVLPQIALSLLAFDESFVTRLNRAREWRERASSYFAIFAIPRWAFASAGIVAIIFTVISFDHGFPPIWAALWPGTALASLVLGLLAVGFRDWRNMFGCGAAIFTAWIIGAWCATRLGIGIANAANVAQFASGPAAALYYFVLYRIAIFRRSNEPMLIACSRALEESAAPVVILSVALSAALAFWGISTGSAALALVPLVHMAGAIVLLPSLITVLEDLFPRRRPLNELYRAR